MNSGPTWPPKRKHSFQPWVVDALKDVEMTAADDIYGKKDAWAMLKKQILKPEVNNF